SELGEKQKGLSGTTHTHTHTHRNTHTHLLFSYTHTHTHTHTHTPTHNNPSGLDNTSQAVQLSMFVCAHIGLFPYGLVCMPVYVCAHVCLWMNVSVCLSFTPLSLCVCAGRVCVCGVC